MSRTALATALAASVVACADGPPSAHRAVPTAPSYSFVNGPEDPGPIVLRSSHDDFFVLFNTDRATQLASLIRLPDPPGDVIPCGGTQPLDPADLQLVFHANGPINQLLVGREVRAYVYERRPFVAAVSAGGLCYAITTQVPIAQGPVDFTAYDNDTFFSGIHADAFGLSAVGAVVRAADGATLRYQNESHGVLAADGSLINIVNSITLSPTAAP